MLVPISSVGREPRALSAQFRCSSFRPLRHDFLLLTAVRLDHLNLHIIWRILNDAPAFLRSSIKRRQSLSHSASSLRLLSQAVPIAALQS